MRSILCIAIFAFFALDAPSQTTSTQTEEYRVYTEHPRLFLRPQRLKLLKRERERQSMRWKQFETLVAGKARMPEPGFAWALYYAISGDRTIGKQAIDWALGEGTDLKQLSLVFDWCQDLLTESQTATLATKIQKGMAAETGQAIPAQRNRALAAIVIAEQNQNATEAALRKLAEQWWKAGVAAKLNNGANVDPGSDMQALLEILHAVRDNLTIDLRSDSPSYFKALPAFAVICNYPAPYPGTENEYRIPFYTSNGDPDLTRATLARTAGLSLVAFDTNALENQFLQGWLIQDRFMLRGVFGAPYEFLWANPYQPGLAYVHLPLVFHDQRSGSLFVRSSWEEDAVWFALHDSQTQLFRDGKVSVLNTAGKSGTIQVGEVSVLLARQPVRFQADNKQMFVVGNKPRGKYDVEVDDEEMTEVEADAAGTLALQFGVNEIPGVRIKESPHGRE